MSNFTEQQLAEINSIITGRILDFFEALTERGQILPGRQTPPVLSGGGAGGALLAGTPRLATVTDIRPRSE